MSEHGRNDLLSPALKSISQLLQEDDVEDMVIGGLAASLLGRPRYTNDIDLVILNLDDRLHEFIKKINKFGIEPRIPDVENFAIKSRMLLMRHIQSGINIDISMAFCLLKERLSQEDMLNTHLTLKLYSRPRKI